MNMALTSLYKKFSIITKSGAVISGVAIFLSMLFITADVLLRNFVGGSIPGSFEIVQNYFMPLAVFPGIAWVYSSGIMPRMDLLVGRMTQRWEGIVIHIFVIFEVVIAAAVFWYSLDYALQGLARSAAFTAGGDSLPLWPAQFLAPLGILLLLIEVSFVLARNIRADNPGLIWKES